jgi:hypothetical protein
VSFPQLCCDSSQSHNSPVTCHILKSSDDGTVWPFQLPMTAGAAIRIVLHSAKVAHFCHNICNNSSGVTGPDLSHLLCGLPTITFHLHTLVQAPLPMSLASQPWQTTILGIAHGLGRTFTSFHVISLSTEAASA